MHTRLLPLKALCLIALLAGAGLCPANAQSDNLLTNVSQISVLAASNTRTVTEVKITGLVYGIDRVHSALALGDTSGLMWMDIEKLPDEVQQGSLVLIEGTVTAGKNQVFLGKHSIVEGEYYTDISAQSGRVFLSAGKHRFELLYHQLTQRAILDLTYQGPGIAPSKIPASLFWHSDTNAPAGFARGLKYDCYRGYTTEYPNFPKLTPDLSGIAPVPFGRFVEKSTNALSRKTGPPNANYVLRFDGFLQIDAPGTYQFNMTADDGARLTLDYNSKCDIKVIGRTNVPAAITIQPAQAWNSVNEPAWAMAEGKIEEIGELDGRLQLKLRGDSGSMEVTVGGGEIGVSAILLQSRVRITGLAYGTVTFHGERIAGKMLAPGMRQISLLNVSDASWETVPHMEIASLPHVNSTNLEKFPVNVSGIITNVQVNRSFILKDGKSEVEVRNMDIHTSQTGQPVDVLGMVDHAGLKTILRYTTYRPHRETNGLPQILTSISQIRQLHDPSTSSNYPVKVQGIVLQVETGGLRANIRDESAGIVVFSSYPQPSALHVGDICEFAGHVEWNGPFPSINYTNITMLGQGQLPEPLHPTRNELLNGSVDGQWVEVQGVVVQIQPSASALTLGLPGGPIRVQISRINGNWADYPNAILKVRGVAKATFNKYSAPEDATISIDSTFDVTIVTPSPQNLFNLPYKSIPDLLVFDPNATAVPFVKVHGQIVFASSSTYYLMDGTNGMHFTAPKSNLAPGDIVDVVGIPENDRLSPNLQNSIAKKLRHGPLPAPTPVAPGKLNRDIYESTLVQIETTLLGVSTNINEQVLELQLTPSRVVLGRLDLSRGALPYLLPQSKVRVTGVFTGNSKKDDISAALLINSPDDVVVLQTPPWWNVRRSVTALALMGIIVLLAIVWIRTLRRRVESRTRQLSKEILEHQRTEAELNEKTSLLQNEIEERKRIQIEVENIHRQLVDASRQAGQAEVAVNVLHNVGNVLNSVNISTTIVTDRIRKLRPGNIAKAADLIEERNGTFSSTDEKGQQLIQFLRQVATHWTTEQQSLLTELRSLGLNIEHIKEIVVTQQAYAKRVGIFEKISISEIVENAIKVHSAAYARHSIEVVRDYEDCPEAVTDKHKILQILVNFFQNAKYACDEGGKAEKIVTVLIRHSQPDRFCVTVADNGIGVAPENLTRIFTHGFTTRKDGHGFGLHSAALAAKEMGGSVVVQSEGLGKGASFTLELPLESKTEIQDPHAVNTIGEKSV